MFLLAYVLDKRVNNTNRDRFIGGTMDFIATAPSLTDLEFELVYKLKKCYIDIFFEDKVNDCENWFINAIKDSILQGNQALHNLFTDNANCEYHTNKDDVIFTKFMQHIEPLVGRAFQIANVIQNIFNSTTDLVGILLPFILQKMQICNEDVGIFVGVAILIAQLIVQQLAEQDAKRKEKTMETSIESICRSNITYLQQLAEMDNENKEVIQKCIEANSNMLNTIYKEER